MIRLILIECTGKIEIWKPRHFGSLRPVQVCNGIALAFTGSIRKDGKYDVFTNSLSY